MDTAGYKVLIIEDRRENIVFLANNIFKPKGFEIITAMDGEAGLRKALEENPDLIFTDLNLPKMRGLDILADLQDRGSEIPSVVMTFHGSEETAIRAFRLGARDYLIKPFSVEDVERAIARALQAKQQSQSVNTTPPSDADATRTQMLEQKTRELELIIAEQKKSLEQQASQHDSMQAYEARFQEQEKQIENFKQECSRLTSHLIQQKKFTSEARNSAKAMIQFIRAQHKEILRQKHETEQLSKQVSVLTSSLDKLLSRLNKQVHQFQIVSPNSDK